MIETERKYLIETPDFSHLADMDGYSSKSFAQTYLSAPKGVTRRVRRSEKPCYKVKAEKTDETPVYTAYYRKYKSYSVEHFANFLSF